MKRFKKDHLKLSELPAELIYEIYGYLGDESLMLVRIISGVFQLCFKNCPYTYHLNVLIGFNEYLRGINIESVKTRVVDNLKNVIPGYVKRLKLTNDLNRLCTFKKIDIEVGDDVVKSEFNRLKKIIRVDSKYEKVHVEYHLDESTTKITLLNIGSIEFDHTCCIYSAHSSFMINVVNKVGEKYRIFRKDYEIDDDKKWWKDDLNDGINSEGLYKLRKSLNVRNEFTDRILIAFLCFVFNTMSYI